MNKENETLLIKISIDDFCSFVIFVWYNSVLIVNSCVAL